MTAIKPPPTTRSGNYDPVALVDLLAECRRNNVPPTDLAKALSIGVDRAVYALGEGYEAFVRRAQRSKGWQ